MPFKPDDYIQSLIQSINADAAKARTAGLAMMLTGLYLVGIIITTTDEAMLLGESRTLPQLGIVLPVVISYALAPPIFLFLHVSMLILYERVGKKLAHYDESIGTSALKTNRTYYDALLSTSNFTQAYLHKRNERKTGYIPRSINWFTMIFFPLCVLLAVQIDFVRYQHDYLTILHLIFLAIDILTLAWFTLRTSRLSEKSIARSRNKLDDNIDPKMRWIIHLWHIIKSVFRVPTFCAPVIFMFWLGILHANVPGPNSQTVGIDPKFTWSKAVEKSLYSETILNFLYGGWVLDGLICKAINRGCRYIRLADRSLFKISEQAKIVAAIQNQTKPITSKVADKQGTSRNQSQQLPKPLRRVAGLDLRNRTLRFADFGNSQFYNVILINADLRGANLQNSQLQFSNLRNVQLQKANLQSAQLYGADMSHAQLQGAQMSKAWLQNINLNNAQLQGADLSGALLQEAVLHDANLQGANLTLARLQGANLRGTRLESANMKLAWIQGADLRNSWMKGTNLNGARLQGADLRSAKLQGADLRFANIRSALFDRANIRYSNLLGAIRFKITDNDIRKLKIDLNQYNINEKSTQRILSIINKRRTRLDNLENSYSLGAYCKNIRLKNCGNYASESEYYKAAINTVFHPMACEGVVNSVKVRGLANQAIIIFSQPKFSWRISEMLLNKQCSGRVYLSKIQIINLKKYVKMFKLK